jgi:hypothetical protein
MPTRPPDDFSKKPRAKSAVAQDARHETANRKRRVNHSVDTIDWLALWSLSIAVSAFVMAAVVYNDDAIGAAVILTGAAIIMALVLLFSRAPGARD